MINYYLNEDKTYRPATLDEWAVQFETMDRHVADDVVDGRRISTVWLGLDHNILSGPPLLFETMVFSGHHSCTDIYIDRYSTWEEAVAGHQKAIEWVKKHYGEQCD